MTLDEIIEKKAALEKFRLDLVELKVEKFEMSLYYDCYLPGKVEYLDSKIKECEYYINMLKKSINEKIESDIDHLKWRKSMEKSL